MRSNPAAESHAHSTLDNETRKLVAKSRKAIRRLILALKRVIEKVPSTKIHNATTSSYQQRPGFRGGGKTMR